MKSGKKAGIFHDVWKMAGLNSASGNDVTQNRWQMVMTVFAVLAFVGCVLEYFFTRERITEEDMVELEGETTYSSSTK